MGYLSSVIQIFKHAAPQLAFQKVKVLSLAIVATVSLGLVQPAIAVDYNQEIQKLRTQNDSNGANRADLQTQAASLETKIANLQTTIATLEETIRQNQQQREELAANIKATEQEIARQKKLLGVAVQRLYIENDMSLMERMASSQNLSEYVEKEEYGLSVQAEIQKGIQRINQLKKQQEAQKAQVEQLLADNKLMQDRLASEKQEVARLLAMNQEQQASYTQQISANNSQITDLQRQQAEENARLLREQEAAARAARQRAMADAARRGVAAPMPQQAPQAMAPAGVSAVNGRAYPYANALWPNDIPDRWGMYQRQCVSYTAWKVAASGRHMPYWGGRGNAKQWDDNARAAGIPTDSNPRVGDVAVSNRGYYGHVMYVEAVNTDGTIRISQYNARWDGRYSEATIMPDGLVFIHFR
ncbi:MAG TPA: CHAP domain-containing protein [Candidatus Limnocylindrales bacterium]|nr:CHAP domain-containing protein [Candidatus Limnocylindrales bacterium]